jgi:hypothetical protein
MQRLIIALAALIGLSGQALPERYAEGQVWEYRVRPGDEGSLLKIQQIEILPEFAERGPVYHISVIGVRIAGQRTDLQHIPVARGTLDASVTRLAPNAPEFPDPAEGIRQWREARGGVFTIAMEQITAFVDQTISGAVPSPAPQS